jgi:hypothetical protein
MTSCVERVGIKKQLQESSAWEKNRRLKTNPIANENINHERMKNAWQGNINLSKRPFFKGKGFLKVVALR